MYDRFVEVGRVALVCFGPDNGKLCVIVDVIDQNRVLVDGPFAETGVRRQSIPLTRLSLTKLTIPVPRSARHKTLVKYFKAEKVTEKWEATTWAKKLAVKSKRASLNDFQRFEVRLAQRKRSKIINGALKKLRVESSKKKKEAFAKKIQEKAKERAAAKAKTAPNAKVAAKVAAKVGAKVAAKGKAKAAAKGKAKAAAKGQPPKPQGKILKAEAKAKVASKPKAKVAAKAKATK